MPYTITGPAMVNIFAPTPRMKRSACVNLGRSVFFETGKIISNRIKILQANSGKEIEGADIIRSQTIPLYYTYCSFTLKSDQIGQAIFISDRFCFPQHIG